jgi:single stranded DNA-binding protein
VQGWNRVQLMGIVLNEPRLTRPRSSPLLKLHLEVTDRVMNRGAWVDTSEWFMVSVWSRLAEDIAPRVQKGSRVLAEGALRQVRYRDRHEKLHEGYEVVASTVTVIDAANEPCAPAAEQESA